MKGKYYLGRRGSALELFKSDKMPTERTHGSKYSAVIGPFRSKRGALYMAEHPEIESVQEAEKLASNEFLYGVIKNGV